MPTGPNQILIKRSDTAGTQPSGLSFGEPAINTADGKLFFAKQTNGTPANDFWEFQGFTGEGGREYNYQIITGALNTPNATSNGDFIYNQDNGKLSIYKFDKNGKDFREELSSVPGSQVTGKIVLTFSSSFAAQPRSFEFDAFNEEELDGFLRYSRDLH